MVVTSQFELACRKRRISKVQGKQFPKGAHCSRPFNVYPAAGVAQVEQRTDVRRDMREQFSHHVC
jgi:hypothetical protein